MQIISQIPSKPHLSKQSQKHQALQHNILKFSSLSIPTQICSFDTQIAPNVYLHEIRCGFTNKSHIVLLHGFGATSLTFIRLFKKLSTRYFVHALDLLGVGLSSRVELKKDATAQQAIDYHIDAVENWRKAVGLKTFTLAGHSFGGYLAAMYARKYPYAVDRLLLISAPGVSYANEQINKEAINQLKLQATFKQKLFYSLAKTLLFFQLTPSQAISNLFFSNYILRQILQKRFCLSGQQLSHWKSYYKAICSLAPTSQRSFHKIFYLPTLGCEHPISHMLCESKHQFKIEFYYGDYDTMEKNVARQLTEKRVGGNRIVYRIVERCGHQILWNNPEGIAGWIVDA